MSASPSINLPAELIDQCRAAGSRTKVADSTGAKLSGSDLILRSIFLRRLLRKHVFSDSEKNVAVLLPPSVPAAVVNFALAFDQRVSVNLNYTVSDTILNQCLEAAEIQHVLTSRKVMEKLNMNLSKPIVYLEDFKEKATLFDKINGFLWAKLAPASMLKKHLKVDSINPSDPLTIIFTSGSTGVPKGVVLSHQNIAHNVHAIGTAIGLDDKDAVLGVLPFFHSFGYTVTLWAATALPPMAVYHYNPLDARTIGKLCEQFSATVLLGTPTFLRTYIRRVKPEQFKTLDVVVVGAEKMPISLADEFESQFGVRPIEGYGTTELSPVVSVNLPARAKNTDATKGVCEGSVGRCLPGVEARVVSPESHEVLSKNTAGMLQIKGPNVMLGYLNQPELTNKVLKDGWYETGDMALIDDQDFIHITGRLSRFSKIGGEMVPHIQIEEMLNTVIDAAKPVDTSPEKNKDNDKDDDGMSAVVTAVPDEKKGERLIVLHKKLPLSVDEILKKLSDGGLPNLFLPSRDSFFEVETIPMLGSGKLDLKGIRDVAIAKTTNG